MRASIAAVSGVFVLAGSLTGCSGQSAPQSVPGTTTTAGQVAALRAGELLPVDGFLETLTFRRTCIRDAVTTVCAALVAPGPISPYAQLPADNLGDVVSLTVERGEYPGHPKLLTWSAG